MGVWRVSLRLDGPQGTPFHSGTLFGQVCWAWRDLWGEASLVSWLAGLRERPFVLSDGMPAGYVPVPLLTPRDRGAPTGPPDPGRAQGEKELRKRAWMTLAGFAAVRGRMSAAAVAAQLKRDPEPAGFRAHRMAHNTIDRRTGRTPESGGLYFVDERWPGEDGRNWEVYVAGDLGGERLADLFQHIGQMGYGRDASLGRGRFQAEASAAPAGLFEAEGTRRMSLSHGALSANMRAPLYRLETHYGKTGAAAGTAEGPFKYPLTLLRPGATFAGEGSGPFGALLEGVHPRRPEVVHNAWHLTLAFTEEEEEERHG